MSALGWVATMQDGRILPFRLARFDFDSAAHHAAAEAGVDRMEYRDDRSPDGAVFEIRGTVARPLLRGGTVTKLVLRACPSPR